VKVRHVESPVERNERLRYERLRRKQRRVEKGLLGHRKRKWSRSRLPSRSRSLGGEPLARGKGVGFVLTGGFRERRDGGTVYPLDDGDGRAGEPVFVGEEELARRVFKVDMPEQVRGRAVEFLERVLGDAGKEFVLMEDGQWYVGIRSG
jgi:hypothetical protein